MRCVSSRFLCVLSIHQKGFCWVVSSEEERFLDAEEVAGSSPAPPTKGFRKESGRGTGLLFL